MGNLLLRIIAAMAVFVGIVLLIGTMIPRNFEASSGIVIDAPPEDIFPYLNTMRFWSEWTMWNDHEIASLDVDYSGAESGVGAIQKWKEPRGEGKLWITESIENQQVKFTSVFANFPAMQSSLSLEPVDGGTRLVWHSEGSLPGGPFYGWFGLTFSDSLATEYKKSLEKLKSIIESANANASEQTGESSSSGAPDE